MWMDYLWIETVEASMSKTNDFLALVWIVFIAHILTLGVAKTETKDLKYNIYRTTTR